MHETDFLLWTGGGGGDWPKQIEPLISKLMTTRIKNLLSIYSLTSEMLTDIYGLSPLHSVCLRAAFYPRYDPCSTFAEMAAGSASPCNLADSTPIEACNTPTAQATKTLSFALPGSIVRALLPYKRRSPHGFQSRRVGHKRRPELH